MDAERRRGAAGRGSAGQAWPVAVRLPRAPFLLVDRLVLREQLGASFLLELVERSGEMVVDENVLGAGDRPAGLIDATAVIVVLEETDAERFVQRTDLLVDLTTQHHAEERRSTQRRELPHVTRGVVHGGLQHAVH